MTKAHRPKFSLGICLAKEEFAGIISQVFMLFCARGLIYKGLMK